MAPSCRLIPGPLVDRRAPRLESTAPARCWIRLKSMAAIRAARTRFLMERSRRLAASASSTGFAHDHGRHRDGFLDLVTTMRLFQAMLFAQAFVLTSRSVTAITRSHRCLDPPAAEWGVAVTPIGRIRARLKRLGWVDTTGLDDCLPGPVRGESATRIFVS